MRQALWAGAFVPACSGTNLASESVERLAQLSPVVAIKEAFGALNQVHEIGLRTSSSVLPGNDRRSFPMLAAGALGVISVAANLVPKDVIDLIDAARSAFVGQAVGADPSVVRINADFGGFSVELGRLGEEDLSIAALQGFEGPLSWLFLHLLLIAVPAVAFFLVGRRGRLHLWHFAAIVLLTALVLIPAVACVNLNSNPEAWLSVMRMHASGSPGVDVMGMHSPGWAKMLVALSIGFGVGAVLLRAGRRGHVPQGRPSAPPADA